MARKPRIHYPGALYHVMLRGNGGGAIFFEEGDRFCFEALVAEGVARFGHRIHAYCWMHNHVHLAIEVADIPLSRIIQNLAFRYARAVNQRQARRGHLFQGRYKAILVDADSYLLELVRYIHLNPLRAGIVREPRCYRWSSHRAYLGEQAVRWLSIDWVLSRFAVDRAVARGAYQRYVLAGINEGRRDDFHRGSEGGRLLGDDRFIEDVLRGHRERARNKPDLRRLIELVCEELGVAPGTLLPPGKDRRAAQIRKWVALLYQDSGGTLTEAAKYFNRDITTLSRQVKPLVACTHRNALPERLQTIATRLGLNTRIQA
jgi:REP element-mobilizing transposase RayT